MLHPFSSLSLLFLSHRHFLFFRREISKRSRGKLALPRSCFAQHVPFTSVTSALPLPPFPFLLSSTDSSSPFTHPPISKTHTSSLGGRGGLGFISALANTHSPAAVPLSSVQSSYPSSAVLLTSRHSPPFSLFFPISSAQMRCCVQRRVCTFLIAGSCPGIRWGKWACNETESSAVQTHTRQVCRYLWCMCVGTLLLIKVTLFLISLLG